MVGGDGGRADDDLGAVRLEHVALVLARPCRGRRRRSGSPCAGRRGPGRRRCCREVGSTIVPPGLSSPDASAASIMRRAMRSFTDPPGLRYSTLASTVAGDALGDRVELDEGRVADEVGDVLCVLHPPILSDGWTAAPRPAAHVGRPGAPGTAARPALPWWGSTCRGVRLNSDGGASHGPGTTRAQDRRHAAYGGGGLAAGIGALGALGYGLLKVEATDGPPDRRPALRGRARRRRHVYGAGSGEPGRAASSSATPRPPAWAPTTAYQTVGAIIANGVSALTRPAGAADQRRGHRRRVLRPRASRSPTPLDRGARARTWRVIMIGANDVTHRIDKSVAVRHLETVVAACATPAPRSSSAPAPTSAPSSRSPSRCGCSARRWSPRPGRGPDRRRRRGRRAHRLARRPARPGVRRAPARDVQRRPLPPLPRRLRPGRRGAAAQRLRRARRLGRRAADDRLPDTPPRRGRRPGRRRRRRRPCATPAPRSAPPRSPARPRGPRGRWAVLLRRPHKPVPTASELTGEPDGVERSTGPSRCRTGGAGRGRRRRPARARPHPHTGPSRTAYHRG